jgi:periplasmic divalent cation tolerance protein
MAACPCGFALSGKGFAMTRTAGDFCLVYVTAKDRAEAEVLAQRMVSLRLAACANILGEIRSIYRWKGTVQDESECALIFKTRRDLYPRLEAEIRDVHGYECPCIVALPLVAGSAPFLAWLDEQVAP